MNTLDCSDAVMGETTKSGVVSAIVEMKRLLLHKGFIMPSHVDAIEEILRENGITRAVS